MDEAIEQFLSITNTDSRDMAEYYLNVSNGDLQMALGMVYEDGGASSSKTEVKKSDNDCVIVDDLKPNITVLEWNIQGLLDDYLQERTVAVVNTIRQYSPTVVMLQEVILETYLYMKSALKSTYTGFSPSEISSQCGQYFTCIFINKSLFKSCTAKVVSFSGSRQGRDILIVEGKCHNLDVAVLTSHLESTKTGEQERKRQLGILYSTMMQFPSVSTVIFGGDTNLRDAEFTSVVHSGKFDATLVKDIWEILGSPQDVRYSWDLQNNDNQVKDGKARLRFARMYTRVETSKQHFKPTEMRFVGMKRLSCGMFPSDHWGILTTFAV
ncbi:tyrosyl-DNA phosphodiesterase 2-like [Styela clava]